MVNSLLICGEEKPWLVGLRDMWLTVQDPDEWISVETAVPGEDRMRSPH